MPTVRADRYISRRSSAEHADVADRRPPGQAAGSRGPVPVARRDRPRGPRRDRARDHPPAADARDDRQRERRPPGGPGRPGLGAHQQVRRGLPGPALLRRLRARRRRRAARDRPGEGPLRCRVRQRPAALRRAGQRRGDGRAARTGRHDPGPRPRPRRPPHPRHAPQLLGPALRRRRLPRPRGRPPRRHGRGRPARPGAPPEADHRGLVGLPAPPRLRRVPPHRRRGRGLVHGRHGPLRRAGRRGSAPLPRPARARRHLDDPQDPRRPPRRVRPRDRATWRRSSTRASSPASRAARSSTSSPRRPSRSSWPASRSSASDRNARSTAPASWPTGC